MRTQRARAACLAVGLFLLSTCVPAPIVRAADAVRGFPTPARWHGWAPELRRADSLLWAYRAADAAVADHGGEIRRDDRAVETDDQELGDPRRDVERRLRRGRRRARSGARHQERRERERRERSPKFGHASS